MSWQDEINTLLDQVFQLPHFVSPWPVDVTERAFVEIEKDPALLNTYRTICHRFPANGQKTVNKYIGKQMRLRTTDVNRGRATARETKLIKTYEKH